MIEIEFTAPEPGHGRTARTVVIRPDNHRAPCSANEAQTPSKQGA